MKFTIFLIMSLFSSNLFAVHCFTLAENSIPSVNFSLTMQHEFRQKLSLQLQEFDDLSEFSFNFIGTIVSQKNIDAAMSKAFEIFGIKLRKKREQERKKIESKDIENFARQEADMKKILIQVVMKRQYA